MIPIAKPMIGAEEKEAVFQVLDSGMLASGEIVRQFENEFAAYLNAEHCIAASSGTTALEVALRALGIGPGDKVLTTPFSFIASTNSIIYTGATPVFAEIDEQTFNLDPDKLESALAADPSIKALLIVHLFGQACDMDRVMALVKKYKLLLIEDCAQAHGSLWKGRKVGTFGDAGCFSFYPTKNMTTGEGGAVVTNNAETAEACRLLINHGMAVRYHHDRIGYNYRLTNMAAAIGRCQLKKLDGFNQARRENAAYFTEHLNHSNVIAPVINPDAWSNFHQYTIRVLNGKRDALADLLSKKGIGYGIFYPLTIPEQKCFEQFNFQTSWGISDKVKEQVLSLPIHPALSEADRREIVETINQFEI